MYFLVASFALLFSLCKGIPHDIPDYQYTEIIPYNVSQPPTGRKNFGMAAAGDWLYLFGGVLPDDDQTYVTDVWAFGTGMVSFWNKTEWTFKRSSHCVTQINENAYFIGGVGDPKSPNFRLLNLTSGVWNDSLSSAPAGDHLFPACAAVVEKKAHWVASFGGCAANGEVCSNILSIYNVMNNTWDTVPGGHEFGPPPTNGATLTDVVTTDVLNRQFHYLVILGGYPFNHTETFLYAYNLTSMSWMKPLPLPDLPLLAYHTTTKTKDGNLVIFGGITANNEVNSETFIVEYSPDSLLVNITTPKNTTGPVGRRGHAALFEFNRMLVYGGNISTVHEEAGNVWQLVVEKECLNYTSCGLCLLNGCYFCNPNPNNTLNDPNSYCVAGNYAPYISKTCPHPGWNVQSIKLCRPKNEAPLGLTIGTIVAFILIFFLVVAVYFVDYRKAKAGSGGYEPIGGM